MPGFRWEEIKERARADPVFLVLVIGEIILILWIILGYFGYLPLF